MAEVADHVLPVIKKQQYLFYGYIRIHVINVQLPMDIIDLCFKFYNIDIQSLYDDKNDQKVLHNIFKIGRNLRIFFSK